jgi:hypothetical protein
VVPVTGGVAVTPTAVAQTTLEIFNVLNQYLQ